MRNQWLRLFLLRGHIQSQSHICRQYQVNPLRSFTSSLFRPHSPHVTRAPYSTYRCFSSSPEIAVEPPKPPPDEAVALLEIFAKPDRSAEEIKLELDSNNVVITHDLILSALGSAQTAPDVANRLFNWVLESDGKKLRSKSYNLMLEIFGGNGFVKESWDVIGIMKKKGYGVWKGTFDKIFEKFKEEGWNDDVEKLKELYASGSGGIKNIDPSYDNSIEKVCSKVCEIIQREVWGDNVEKQLQESVAEFSSDLVRMVLENLEFELNKGFIFFMWVEESGLFRHDSQTYNAMARVLGRGEFIDKFWRIVNEMRNAGKELERETYIKVSQQFVKEKMIKNAVDLYEFAMTGTDKPSVQDCVFLLRKIVTSKELDMDLFLKVVEVFKESGNVFTNANMNSVFKALTSAGRWTGGNKLLKAMMEGGYIPNASSQCKIVYKLSSSGKNREASELMETMIKSEVNSNHNLRTWVSLLKGYCEARDLNEATATFFKMIEQEGASCTGYALELMVDTYCRKNRPLDAYKLVRQMVDDKGLNPWHTTYKSLTNKLLAKKRFKAALNVMDLMKNHGYPPYLDAFVDYLSKTGSAEEAITFSQAMTSKRYPSKSVFLGLFEAYLKAGRKDEAQNFLAKCPRHIKNHADVLNMFCAMKS